MKVIVRIKGGLGNQLYCYAAAKRVALKNNAELVIDNVSGFKRDYLYRSEYLLDFFNISARLATPNERLEPLERIRRGIIKKIQQLKPFESRTYIEQEFNDFDSRMLDLKILKNIYIDGLWQSLKYFDDIDELIRNEFTMQIPTDEKNLLMSESIKNSNSVAIHVRWFEDGTNSKSNVNSRYYEAAIEKAESLLDEPHYFVFSDNPEFARKKINFPNERVTYISHNSEKTTAIWDFWLMRQCKHFIIANSTFSWWAAWLSISNEKVVLFPRLPREISRNWCWDYEGQMPEEWYAVKV